MHMRSIKNMETAGYAGTMQLSGVGRIILCCTLDMRAYEQNGFAGAAACKYKKRTDKPSPPFVLSREEARRSGTWPLRGRASQNGPILVVIFGSFPSFFWGFLWGWGKVVKRLAASRLCGTHIRKGLHVLCAPWSCFVCFLSFWPPRSRRFQSPSLCLLSAPSTCLSLGRLWPFPSKPGRALHASSQPCSLPFRCLRTPCPMYDVRYTLYKSPEMAAVTSGVRLAVRWKARCRLVIALSILVPLLHARQRSGMH